MKAIVLSTIILSITVISACTKSVDPKLPDSVSERIFAIKDFNNIDGTIQFSTQQKKLQKSEQFKAHGQYNHLKVASIDIPSLSKDAIKDLFISTPENNKFNVRVKVNQHQITLYKTVKALSQLTEVEQHISIKEGDLYYAPIFSYKISSHGVITQNTDNYGEKTSTLRLQKTTWNKATHIEASLLPKDRIPLDVPNSNLKEKDEIFLKDKINNQVMTALELNDVFKLKTSLMDSALVYTQIDGQDTLAIFEAVTLASLTNSQREWFESGSSNGRLLECPQVLIDSHGFKADDCVLISRFSAQIAHQVAVLNKSEYDDTTSTTIDFQDANSSSASNIIRIIPNQILALVEINDNVFDPRNTFKLSELSGEFLFRRTLNDVANGFKFTFPGAQGRLEIVKFEALEGRLVVKKADAIVKPNGGTQLDTEEVLALPAKYFTLETVDEQGNTLSLPRRRPARFDDKNIYVEVDWANNKIPNVLSPLAYHGVGQCFQGTGGKTITDLEQNLNSGVLNFTVSGSYTVAHATCASQYLTSDYYFRPNEQRTFNFKERISFRKYDGANDDNIISDIPFYAQKQLNYGVFTTSKLTPNENGNIGRDGSEVHLPILFDFQNSKKIKYTLAGIPTSGPMRTALINATERVIANWNIALREAFSGSDLATSQNLIELEVEGRDINNVQLGDLNRNYIYWLEKSVAAGPLGIGGPSPNPRSGVIEASDIIIYGGNMKSALESVRKRAAAKRFYEQVTQVIPAPPQPPSNGSSSGSSGSSSSGATGSSSSLTNLTPDFLKRCHH